MDDLTVAVVGAGVVGRSWAALFARAGVETRVWDPAPGAAERAVAWVAGAIGIEEHLVASPDLASALDGATFVQESGPDRLEAKRAIYTDLDAVAHRGAILASSTSTLDMTEIGAGLAGADRCVVAHPVNPPHLIPVVEVLAGAATAPHVVDRTCEVLRSVGQLPVRLSTYVPGFVLNRLQAALLREAIHLLASGVATAEDIDTVVHSGLGLRWAFLGPFGTAHANADGGAREYFGKYARSWETEMADLGPTPTFDDALVDLLGRATEAMFAGRSTADVQATRDRAVGELVALKARLERGS